VLKQETTPRRSRLAALAAVLILAVLGIALMPSTTALLKTGGLAADSAESVRADALVKQHFPSANPDLILILTPSDGNRAGASKTIEAVAAMPGVAEVHSYYSDLPLPELLAADPPRQLRRS